MVRFNYGFFVIDLENVNMLSAAICSLPKQL